MIFLKQILVTALILVAGFLGLVAVKPEIGRDALNAGIAVPDVVRDVIVWVAPEAGEPAPEVAQGPGAGPRGGSSVPAVVRAVTFERSASEMRSLASGEAVRSVAVHPENTTGTVVEVPIVSGQEVAAGDPLVGLERSSETVAVERARLNLRAANEKFQRYETLTQRNAITSVELSDVAVARDAAELDLQAAEITLAKRIIRAPIDGRIGIVAVEPGTLVDTTTTIATIDDRSELNLVFYTPERFLPDITVGSPISAVSVARPDEVFSGEIIAIDSRVEPESRTVRTEAQIPNEKDSLRPGMSFSIKVGLEGKDYFSTDPLAVVWERTGPLVWKVADGKATKAPIRIVQRDIDRVLFVSDAIETGDLVVVEGIQSMREGVELDIIEEPGSSEPVAETESPQDQRDVSARSGSLPLIGAARAEDAAPTPTPSPRSGS